MAFICRWISALFRKRAYRRFIDKTNKRFNCKIRYQTQIDGKTELEPNVRLEGGDYRGTKIGRHTFAGNSSFPQCKIGRFCSIGTKAGVIMSSHPTDFVSSWPGFFDTCLSPETIRHFNDNLHFDEFPRHSSGAAVLIGNDVWIGNNVSILAGVEIGNGAIVGANALVTKNVPPYAIVGGVPAKIIRYRFSNEDIHYLENLSWWDWTDEQIQKYAKHFSSVQALRGVLENDTPH